ncbi:beta/gamma crystallin domain-containing protein 1-like [Carassius carassius]|uniref:beta/gamma crystallin domain-containing protein 1-like n=1 Tax=Carassius carassius TaxID=217509 RepID=UPI002868E65D|nr:beta/gamma crystallin domain-containing protein 1-like [Carassius carassius]
MAESPQEHSPGVLSRIGSWLSWGWGRNDPTSQTQQEEDHKETRADETDSPSRGETSPALERNAKHLRLERSPSIERGRPPDLCDQMGRKRSNRRRRSSHRDEGGAKSPTSPQPESPEATSLTSGPRMTCADSAFEETPDSLPEEEEAPSSGNREDVFQTHLSEDADSDSLTRAALANTDMNEERVVRLTESAESKRRSIKVSHSEVVFPKKVLVASEEQREDQKVAFKDTERLRSDGRARYPEDRVDGTNVKSKGRIADKISLFERGATNPVSSSTNLRHLDISPARNVASRLFTERAGARSNSAPPNQTVKERAMNFNAGRKGGDNLTLPSGHTLSEGHSKTAEISQSERFEKSTAKTDTSGEPKVKCKPHLNIDQTDSKSHNATQSTPVLSESTSDSNIGNKELDSLPMVSSPTDETPQVKSPNRTSSRSKKRRSKDPRSPTKPEMGQGKQEVKDKPLVDIVKTTEQYSDKERPDSAREAVSKTPKIPPSLEKAAEIMQSTKKISDSPHADTKFPKEMKSKDEKQHSSNEEKTERTEIDSKTEEKLRNISQKQPGHVRSEGEGQRNRDVIVNTLFGESGKPDPSVTKEEKPPSLEDLKEANAKDSFEPANNSTGASRKDTMRNRGSETDTLVLPENTTENTTESEPKSAQRPSKTNQNSREKDHLAEISNQNENIELVRETTETHKNSTEVSTSKPTKQNEEEGITTKMTKHGKSKNTSAVRQEDTTVLPTNEGKETQTTELNSELSDQTKENTTTTSRTPATPNPTLVKDQNDNMDAIISLQIPSTEEGGPKRDEPPLQNQSESGEEQKTQAVSNKRDLQQPSTDIKNGGTKETQSEITGTEITSVINGDVHTVQAEDQVSDSLKQSGENALCSRLENTLSEIPSNNGNLPMISAKKKPTSLSSKAIETCTKQSGQVTAEPASKDDKAFGDNENTTLSNSANKKTNNEKTTLPPASTNVITTPKKPTTVEKNTSPQASTNEKTSTLPTSTKENTTGLSASTNDDENKPQPASTDETICALPAPSNEQTTPPTASANEQTTPPTGSANEKTTPPTGSANEQTTPPTASANEQTTPPTASANEQTTPPTGSANEKTTPPTASANEQTTPPTGSANEQTTPPTASANEQTTPPTGSANEQTTPPTASANEQTTPPTASANEQTTPPTGLANEKTTPPTGSANEQTTPPTASANEQTTPPTGSANEQTTPPTASANEQTTPPTGSANEQTTPPTGLANEQTMPPTGSANEKTTPPTASANEKTTPPAAASNEQTMPPTASGTKKATPLPAPTIETICKLSDNLQTIPSASLTVRSPSTSLASSDEKNKPPPASSNEKDTTPSESTSKMTTNEKTISPQASTNGTTSTLRASPKEKTTPPPASTTETLSATLSSSDDINKLPPASTNETVSALPDSANDKTAPSTASTNEKNTATIESANRWTTNEETTSPQSSTNKTTSKKKTAPLPVSITETISATLSSNDDNNKPSPTSTKEKTTSSLDSTTERTTPPPASTNDTISTLTGLANEKNTPSTALANGKAKPLPAPTIETTSTLSGSDNEKTAPSASSTIEFASSSLGSGDDKTTPPSVLNNDKTTPPPTTTKENVAPLQFSTNPPVSIDITTKNEKTTPQPTSSHAPLTSINGNNITPLPSSKEKTISPPDNESSKATPSPEKPLGPEVSAKEKIFSIKSTTPSTRKKEFILKPFLLPEIPAAPGSSSQSRDSPSSWLDVDHQRPLRKKLLIPDPKLSSSVSGTHLLNTSGEIDPDDFIANVKRLAMPFNLPLRKHNKHRLQAPPFAMPAIKEDHFEKPFDPEEFQHGLRRRREFILDLPSSSKSKSLAAEVKEAEIKPKRESILTRSLIFQRARKGSEKEEEEKEEGTDVNTTEPLKAKSRLERCSIVSVLCSPSKERRMKFLSPTESPSGGLLSPRDGSGSTAPPELQLAPTIEPTKLVPIEETLVKNNSHDTLSGSQVILKSSSDIGPAMTHDLKTSSRDPTVSLLKDSNAYFPSSGSQASSQVVPTPTKDDGPTLAPDLRANSADSSVTMFTDTNVPTPPSDSQTSSQVVLKPMKDIGPTLAPDLKTTSVDLPITMLTDTDAPPPSCTQSGSQDDGLAMTPDLNASTPPSGPQTDSQVVLKPITDDGPKLTTDLKITSLDSSITMLTDANTPLTPSYTQSGSQDDLKLIKDDGPAMIPDLKKTSRDPTVTMFTDTNESLLLNCTQTGSDVALKTTAVDANAPPPCPCFDDIKLPCFLEKFLPKEPENAQPSNKINPLMARESASVPGLVDLNKSVDVADGKIPEETIPPAPVVPAAQIPQAKPQRELPNIPASRGIHRRPGKIVIFEHHQFSGQSFEFYRDQPDATHIKLSSVISIKVVRGCWILYEKPGFEGRCIPLEEEGVIELPNQWTEEGEETSAPVVIGSIRLAVIDYTPPRIELFTEPAGMGRSSEFVDETVEVGSFNRPQSTGSIKVHSGLWLVYSDPGFQGLLAVMEAGEYPFPEDWGFPSPAVGSLRPLRMGALKVEKPNAVKAVLYEKAGLEGRCMEVQGDVFSFARTETDPSDPNCVESLKILGGLWVGYDGEGFEGQQFVLEEGEYLDWTDWGGTGGKLLSLRPVFMDFSSPHMKMFSELDFSERGVCMDLLEPLDNAMNTHYGPQTRSIEVLAGVWVVFEGPGFSGQQYVLEKGLYGSPEDWGSSHSRVCSAIPVIPENPENSCHFQIELFSESGFGGTSVLLKDSLPTIPCGFSVRSCRVHAGSWQAFSGECFSGHQCVLEEGFYPDLRMMGFSEPDASVLSLQPTGLELSVPALLLFERSGLRGRRTPLKTASVNLQLTHSCSRVSSVLVLGGIWVLYEDHNFRGSQILLKPGAIPDWPKLTSWLRIGSLRPLIQKQVHFRLRNKEAGLLMSVSGLLDDIKLMRIQVSNETGGAEQIWTYQDGQLRCKALLDVCVDVSSGGLMSGSRVVLSAEAGRSQQLWSVSSDGIIRSHARAELVLEVKGGQQFDKHQIIVNEFHPDKLNQRWSLELL